MKRNGSLVPWNAAKITRAIALAFYDVRHGGAANPCRDDAARCFGLQMEDFLKAMAITQRVSQMLELGYLEGIHPGIEAIQDTVEKAIAAEGEWEVARSYILYRHRKAELRLHSYPENGLEEYIAVAKYARYRPDLGRRETFAEAVDRVAAMHRKRLDGRAEAGLQDGLKRLRGEEVSGETLRRLESFVGDRRLGDLIDAAFQGVRDKKVLPSMRSLQFGGAAIEACEARMFNCAYSPIDRPEFFRQYFFLLLAGVGCGFSVQKHHVERLPPLAKRGEEFDLPVRHHTVEDTIEGWGDALGLLADSYFQRFKVEFNYSRIRPRGAPLLTSGGKAPGHLPLKRALTAVERILAAAPGRRLRPIEVYDICMHVAKAVLSGGVRRSATICLFSPEDAEMMEAKTGEWFEEHPQRSASNNSAVIDRDSGDFGTFLRLFERQKEFGEPGFYFSADSEYGCNPCCEIGLNPVLKGQMEAADEARLRELGYAGELNEESRLSGWQMCNLTTINGGIAVNEEAFLEGCILATLIGTLQAAYTDIPYLGAVSRFLNERESLLGVSICGIMDNPEVLLEPEILSRGARLCRATNALIADAIGIRRAARITCVKPEGTASLLLSAGSGIHPHHAKRYFRRVQANRSEPVYRHFREKNPHLTEPSVYQPDSDDVITFPVQAPETAILRAEIGALDFLRYVRLVQRYWVQEGLGHEAYSPGLHHNVSNTCTVKPEEWESVAHFIWEHRAFFTGVALLANTGDKAYAQAPREQVVTEEDIVKWNRLRYVPVDYTQMREAADETNLKDVIACAGGACELV